ncbi:anti-sigma factor [Nocardia suismassiliense]|uniref:anti-sigma factor n=1 Tax=Nocardia suismassiliense TaxID=2077092 RepID=UPI000D1E730C|nr:anti-sigma factor [Nocardia suismassiliense]
MSENGQRGSDLLDLAYPYAMDAVAELERRSIEHRLREADPVTVDAFAAIVFGVRETLAALTVLDATAPPAELETTLLRALDEAAGAPGERRDGFQRSGEATGASDPGGDRLPWSGEAAGMPGEGPRRLPQVDDQIVGRDASGNGFHSSDAATDPPGTARNPFRRGNPGDSGSGRNGFHQAEEAAANHKRFQRLRWLAAAVAVIVAIGAGVGVLVNRAGDPGSPGLTAQLVLEQPDVTVKSVPVAGGGTLTVRTSARIAAATVSFESVSAPSPGRSYQVWLVPLGGKAQSATVLTELPSTGPALVTRFDPVDTLAVTVEPSTGSPTPTGDTIASVNLA